MGFKLERTTSNTSQAKEMAGERTSILQREITLFGKPFSNKKKEDFYTELSVLLNAGITLKEGLTIIEANQKKAQQKEFYGNMVTSLISGNSFSDVIGNLKEFTEYEYYSLKIGEESGTMPKITEELGKFYARKNEQRRNLVNGLTYPIIILITAILVVVFMLRMVVPMFQDIFKQNGVELPGITKFIIGASNFVRDYGWLILGMITLLLIFRKTFSKNEIFKRKRDAFLLKLPYVGKFIKAVYMAQFTQAVTLLTSSKVPVLNSIDLVERMIDFYPLKDALKNVSKSITRGSSLSESLKKNTIFDHRMISLVKVAEETNQTEFIFERLNQQYAVEVQQKSKLLATLMEPLIIVVVGVLVGVILIAMYLPMFKLGSVLG